jgi:outer membrane protein TolC
VDLIDKYLALSTYQGDMARNEVEKAKLALEDTKRSVSLEAAQAYYNLQAAKEALASYAKALDAAKENYRLSLLRYENGMATTVEVMQADEELANRENQHQSAVYQYNLALVNFDNAIGN